MHKATSTWHSVVIRGCLVLLLSSLAAPAFAQTTTTGGVVTLSATMNCISVRAKYTGDTNANNAVNIQFRKHIGDSGWHTAYQAYMDRRTSLGGTTNPYANEARVSIVGLVENTSYDVQVTWSDADGVAGQPAIGTVNTLTSSPPTGGSTITVTDNASLSAALNSVSPGQTIHLNAGTYNAFNITRSGNASAWIVIEGQAGTIISGVGVNQNVAVSANFVVVKNLTLGPSDFYGIAIGSNRNNIIVQDNTIQNVSARCADGPTTSHYGDTGINVGGGGNNIFVLRNSVTSTSLTSCIQNPPYDGAGAGIGWTNCNTCMFIGNTVNGAFRDAVSSDSSNNSTVNIDVANNTVSNYVDDGIESKGDNVNVRMWGNTITSSRADTCLAGNTNTANNQYGPVYIFRNVCKITGTLIAGGGAAYKLTPAAPTFVFHNSVDTTGTSPAWSMYVMTGTSGPFTFLNNIARATASMSEHAPSNAIFDYNVGTSNGSWAYLWADSTTYSTFTNFRSATGQEAHGFSANPLFIDTLLRIDSTSPAYNKGLVLNNFNTLDSAWPYTGSAPDVGAFEVPGSGGLPTAPQNFQVVK